MKQNHFDTITENEAATKERLTALTKDDFHSFCVSEAYFSVLHMDNEEAAKHAQ
jgi:hypothetical protein